MYSLKGKQVKNPRNARTAPLKRAVTATAISWFDILSWSGQPASIMAPPVEKGDREESMEPAVMQTMIAPGLMPVAWLNGRAIGKSSGNTTPVPEQKNDMQPATTKNMGFKSTSGIFPLITCASASTSPAFWATLIIMVKPEIMSTVFTGSAFTALSAGPTFISMAIIAPNVITICGWPMAERVWQISDSGNSMPRVTHTTITAEQVIKRRKVFFCTGSKSLGRSTCIFFALYDLVAIKITKTIRIFIASRERNTPMEYRTARSGICPAFAIRFWITIPDWPVQGLLIPTTVPAFAAIADARAGIPAALASGNAKIPTMVAPGMPAPRAPMTNPIKKIIHGISAARPLIR